MRRSTLTTWAVAAVVAALGPACGDDGSPDPGTPTAPSDPTGAGGSPTEPTSAPATTPTAPGTGAVASPTSAPTSDDLGTFVFDATTEYAVIHACVSEASDDRATYESLMVERDGGRRAYEFVVIDEQPDVEDELYFELYGPGDAGAQFTGTATHDVRGAVSFGVGAFDQGGTFAYEIALTGAAPC